MMYSNYLLLIYRLLFYLFLTSIPILSIDIHTIEYANIYIYIYIYIIYKLLKILFIIMSAIIKWRCHKKQLTIKLHSVQKK